MSESLNATPFDYDVTSGHRTLSRTPNCSPMNDAPKRRASPLKLSS